MDYARGDEVVAGRPVLIVTDRVMPVPESGPREYLRRLSGRQGVRIDDTAGHDDKAPGRGQGVVWGEEVGHRVRTVGPGGRRVK